MHNLARFLPESCKINIHSARNLQDNHFSARILQYNHFSARILRDSNFSARISQDNHFSVRIYPLFLHKILKDELINESNSDARDLRESSSKVLRSSKNGKPLIITFFWPLARKLKLKELN